MLKLSLQVVIQQLVKSNLSFSIEKATAFKDSSVIRFVTIPNSLEGSYVLDGNGQYTAFSQDRHLCKKDIILHYDMEQHAIVAANSEVYTMFKNLYNKIKLNNA